MRQILNLTCAPFVLVCLSNTKSCTTPDLFCSKFFLLLLWGWGPDQADYMEKPCLSCEIRLVYPFTVSEEGDGGVAFCSFKDKDGVCQLGMHNECATEKFGAVWCDKHIPSVDPAEAKSEEDHDDDESQKMDVD